MVGVRALILLGVYALLVACTPAQPMAPSGFVATLEDAVQSFGEGHIAWSTYWKLCWQPQVAASAYEVQAVTGEGASPRIRRIDGSCYRMQVAAGRNRQSQGLFNRDAILAFQAGQLAFRVRAVQSNGTASAWSAAYTVGRATGAVKRS